MTGAPPSERRRALWVTSEPPHHSAGGGAVRQAHLIDALTSACDVDVLVVGALDDADLLGRLASVEELAAPDRRPSRSLAARRAGDLRRVVVARLPAEVLDRTGERRALAAALARRTGYDLVHVEHLGLAGLAAAARTATARTAGARLSIDVQNVPSAMAAQALELAPGARQRWLWRAERANARRFQRRSLAAFDVVCAVSGGDADELGVGRVAIVPNGVDVGRLRPGPAADAPRIVFTGTLDYLPNVDAARWFADAVFPLVRRSVPGATLEIVGRSPTAEVALLARRDGVSVVADVPDVAPHLAAARVAVVPVRIGTGSRIKALEAMAAGRPVVGHPVGLEGLAVDDGVHALIADTAGPFAAAVVSVLSDDDLAARLAAAGRDLVERLYRWDRIGEAFTEAVLARSSGR